MRSLSMLVLAACSVPLDATPDSEGSARDEPRIVGGNEAMAGEFPYQVSVQTNWDFHFCGGSLVGAYWVLTAAHCVDDRNPEWTEVELGMLSLEAGGTSFQVEEILVHPLYDTQTHNNDVALLRLSEPAWGHPRVKLVGEDTEADLAGPGDLAVVSGWGTLASGGDSPDRLQRVDVPIVSDEECQEAYEYSDITSGMICAGDLGVGGRDSCQGDSGGPMAVYTDDGLALAGVVSWGRGCGLPDYPGVYARVSHYAGWVAAHVSDVAFVGGFEPVPEPIPEPEPEPIPEPDDHGNTLEEATTLVGDQELSVQLDSGDNDAFWLEGSGSLVVYATGSTDTHGTLFDADGNELASSDDEGELLNFTLASDACDAGCYLLVRGYSDRTSGDYTLHVEWPDSAPAEESDGDWVVAVGDALELEETVAAGAEQRFVFEVVDAMTLTLSATGSTDTMAELLDAAGVELASSDDEGERLNFSMSVVVQPGTYTLVVHGYSETTAGDYTLSVVGG